MKNLKTFDSLNENRRVDEDALGGLWNDINLVHYLIDEGYMDNLGELKDKTLSVEDVNDGIKDQFPGTKFKSIDEVNGLYGLMIHKMKAFVKNK